MKAYLLSVVEQRLNKVCGHFWHSSKGASKIKRKHPKHIADTICHFYSNSLQANLRTRRSRFSEGKNIFYRALLCKWCEEVIRCQEKCPVGSLRATTSE